MQIIVSHPTGNANVRAALKGFLDAGHLSEFHTTIATFPDNLFGKLGKIKFMKEFNRRSYDLNLQAKTHSFPWLETGRLLASKFGAKFFTTHETGCWSVDAVYRNLDATVANRLNKFSNNNPVGIYAYEDGALQSFETAKAIGMTCFYDLPIGYWRVARQLLDEAKNKWPEWSGTITGLKDSASKLERKDKELQLADKIFVASSFTASTLKSFPGKLASVEVIPYGFPDVNDDRQYATVENRPLKLLFVGGLSQRKGLAELFAAVDKFGRQVALTIVGAKTTENCETLNQALKKHTYISSLPHHEILQLMHQHDALVFPSLFEGFGLVISEAMSQGTPVITTERTAGPDLIKDEENGWLVEAGSIDALVHTIDKILSKPTLLKQLGNEARETARKRPWTIYGQELASAVYKQSL